MLKAAGIAAPPKTYAEWTEQAKKIKAAGLAQHPLIWPVKHTGWGGIWVMNTMVASRGGKLLDDKFDVTPEGLGVAEVVGMDLSRRPIRPERNELDPISRPARL